MSRKNTTDSKSSKNRDEEITRLEKAIAKRAEPMLGLCFFALNNGWKKEFPCRDFLQKLYSEAATMEEMVDSYGAQKNRHWFTFRETIAAQKLFSSVNYNLLHIDDASTRYKLLDVERDFTRDIEKILKKLKKAVLITCKNITQQAKQVRIIDGPVPTDFKRCEVDELSVQLPVDRKVRHVHKVGETVVYLSTQFLNLSEDRQVQEILKPRECCEYEQLIPEIIDEEKCRLVEVGFHNLQSLYDTYIFESDIESQNRNLSYLRGHISIIYHLLEIATALIHYYVRHMSKLSRATSRRVRFPLYTEELLSIVFDYLFFYARVYMESANHLCKTMIKSYSEEKTITVSIPNYRGFHVRPSTLIAKIVVHYGSTVSMYLNDKKYNAGAPLELFRANEEINAVKRRYIADVLLGKPELQKAVPKDMEQRRRELQMLFLEMMNNDELMLYDIDLPFEDIEPLEGDTMADLASRCIKHFLSIAKIDVNCDFSVVFEGDNRALNDLKLLAENGYGEDKFGNNTVLPEELSYLRK
ncbi:MAG: HPr family phosphocarrier protein [Spirochaetaceae bacterium]